MSGFIDRENQIFEIIQAFKDAELEFVVVGGYGVSAFQHRFSVDADLVVQAEDLTEFTEILTDHEFEEVEDRNLDVYGGRYLAYQRDRELPVTVDLLVNTLQCRQTNASWSYQYFQQNSTETEIEGSERTVEVPVPEKELLVAVKLHSGRLTDARDAVALADDLDTEKVRNHLDRGDPDKLHGVLEKVGETITDQDFEDAFKGVFQQTSLPQDNIHVIKQLVDDYTG